jgi:signal transduction histidine kinase
MKKQNSNVSTAFLLREKAEKILKKRQPEKKSPQTEGEILGILHEMEVNRIELEIQNAELQQSLLNAELARKKAEMAEKKYTELYDFAPSGFLTLSDEGDITDLNFVAAKMLGKNRRQAINSRLAFFISEENREDFYHFFQNVFSSKEISNCEVVLISAQKKAYYIHMRGILDASQKFCLINLVDISECKKNELLTNKNEELIVAKNIAEESNRLKSAFLQNITHEIRTPLNAICGFSEQINNPDLTAEKRKFFSDIIISSGKQLVSIVDDILTMSTLEMRQVSLNVDEVDLNKVIEELLNIFKPIANAKGIGISAIQPESLSHNEIIIDRSKLIQILTNLISNALKFTHEGNIEFGYKEKRETLEFFVKDSGIGIPVDKHERIFDRFAQADDSIQQHYGGSGLGLTISKGFVDLMGGTIWLKSQPGYGSTFYFTIPFLLVNRAKNPEIEQQGTVNNLFSTFTILVADDHDFNYLLLEEILVRENFKVIRAKNGKEAVDICHKNEEIDFVLMDIRMPVMDGYTATRLIKQIRPDLPVIAQTAAYSKERFYELQKTFDDFLPKVITRDLLMDMLKKYIFECYDDL